MGRDATRKTAGRGLRHPAPPAPSPNIAGPAGHHHRGAETVPGQSEPPHSGDARLRLKLAFIE